MPPVRKQAATEHYSSNEKQQASPITFRPAVRIPLAVPHAMTNFTSTSTPKKRGHGNVCSNPKSHTYSHQQQHRVRVYNTKSTAMKRLRGNPARGNGVLMQSA